MTRADPPRLCQAAARLQRFAPSRLTVDALCLAVWDTEWARRANPCDVGTAPCLFKRSNSGRGECERYILTTGETSQPSRQ
jgi:hypothetical protein